jgi:hypothetical protein
MKHTIYIFLLYFSFGFSQDYIESTFLTKTQLKAQSITNIDNFGTLYYINYNAFYKKSDDQPLNYSNYQLGNITTANAFNSLKINLFYKNFNTIIILDNRLAEIFKIDFNTLKPYKNISHISPGYDNTLWMFNVENQQLELFDYKTRKIKANTLPVQSSVLDIKSNYNYCWLLTENYLYTYNYLGSVISKIENKNYTQLAEDNGNLILKQGDILLFKSKDSEKLIPIKLPKLLINQFLLTNETLYIYDNEMLHQFQLKI